jgi:putative hydrolase of the HAD superfamily
MKKQRPAGGSRNVGRALGVQIMILVFDLDDTLYNELAFVRSGFQAVARFLDEQFALPKKVGFNFLWRALPKGRGWLFDQLLREYGLYSKKRVAACVAVYRRHAPVIRLKPAAAACLTRFAAAPKYLVTDGNKVVQRNKIKALGLGNHFKHCFVTHCYGVKHAKPSPYCFLKICERERVRPEQVVYIGDNPHKDFVGIKPLGFRTVRLMQGAYRRVEKSANYEAEVRIGSLDELTKEFLDELEIRPRREA